MKLVRQTLLYATLCGGFLATLSGSAHAWWNEDFTQRTRVTLNTTAQGVETKEALSGVVVPVRLHSGNFDFLSAKPDGSDLRVVAADDKTPLKFWIERFDGTNELGVVWVQLPNVAPGTDKNQVYVYAGHEGAAAQQPDPAVFDSATLAALTMHGTEGPVTDITGKAKSGSAVVREPNGLIGPAAKLDGTASITVEGEGVKAAAGSPYSISLWTRLEASAGTLLRQGPLSLAVEGGKVVLGFAGARAQGGDLPAGAWAYLAGTVGNGKLTLYVNGEQAAQVDLPAGAPAIEGPVVLGEGVRGAIDQVELASTVRSADWVRMARAAQSADAKLIVAVTQTKDSVAAEGGGESHGYMGILVSNLTVDAWVVIGILAVMFVIAVWVMYDKAVLVGRADKDNQRFLKQFRESRDVMEVVSQGVKHSPVARLYNAGLRELQKRDVGQQGALPLSGASIDAVKAAVDADLVREGHVLNSKMVLLTIAISGGPFLGLLGTVVGVMITFAAIAAAGDVNVNAIAPGIAAALLATVAGLGVAIPALFGYNYLAARIKNISTDMQIFVDEFVTRVAEVHGAR